MEESGCSLKRQREEPQQGVEKEEELLKRQKSYKDIITLLEEDEDEPSQDLSSLISTLQQEISSSSPGSHPHPEPEPEPEPGQVSAPYEIDPDSLTTGSGSGSGSDEGERDKVMKHLLEASDDELGLPNTADVAVDGLDDLLGGHLDGEDFIFPLGGEGLWEFEDREAANYYSFLQSSQVFL